MNPDRSSSIRMRATSPGLGTTAKSVGVLFRGNKQRVLRSALLKASTVRWDRKQPRRFFLVTG